MVVRRAKLPLKAGPGPAIFCHEGAPQQRAGRPLGPPVQGLLLQEAQLDRHRLRLLLPRPHLPVVPREHRAAHQAGLCFQKKPSSFSAPKLQVRRWSTFSMNKMNGCTTRQCHQGTECWRGQRRGRLRRGTPGTDLPAARSTLGGVFSWKGPGTWCSLVTLRWSSQSISIEMEFRLVVL